MANLLEEDTELNWINVNKVAIDTGCVSQYDENEELQCIFDGNTVIILVASFHHRFEHRVRMQEEPTNYNRINYLQIPLIQ